MEEDRDVMGGGEGCGTTFVRVTWLGSTHPPLLS